MGSRSTEFGFTEQMNERTNERTNERQNERTNGGEMKRETLNCTILATLVREDYISPYIHDLALHVYFTYQSVSIVWQECKC
jgi:hypothetical protein